MFPRFPGLESRPDRPLPVQSALPAAPLPHSVATRRDATLFSSDGETPMTGTLRQETP